MKRRKLFALLMTAAMAVSSMSMAVNVFAEEDTTEEAAESEEPAEGEPTAVTTVGPDDGTKYEMWSFVDLHNEFYGKMVENFVWFYTEECIICIGLIISKRFVRP